MQLKHLISYLAIGAAFIVQADIRAVTPDFYGNNPQAWQFQRHQQKMPAITQGGAPVVFIGDSITHFWEGNGQAVWKKYFATGEMRALNLGTSADRTEHVLGRLINGRELDGYEAKCILLMIGTNNSGHFPFDKEPPIDAIEGIRKILNVIAQKQPKARIILTAIFPRGANPQDQCRLRNDVVNREIAKFADGKKIIWCDLADRFLDENGNLPTSLFPDLLHPNHAGYVIWADAIVPIIQKCLTAKDGEKIDGITATKPRYTSSPALPEAAYKQIGWWDNGVVLNQRNKIANNGAKPFDVVWVGDSITHRWYREGGEGRALWAKLSATYNMLNLGIGGDQTQHVLWRLRNGDLSGYQAKVFTVMIGTNNQGHNIPAIAEGIKLIVSEIKTKHPESKIILMPIFPRNASANDNLRVANEKINTLIKPLADDNTVLWLDFNSKFLTEDGTLTKTYMNDLLHPNEKGYQIWYDAITPYLKQYCGK